jgi:serine/threonine protein kinase
MYDPYGSVTSMAPEMIARKYDLKVDLWAAGVVLFSMVMKHLPFDGENDEDVVKDIKKSSIQWDDKKFKSLSFTILDLMRKMLQKDPEYRISATEAFSHDFIARGVS